MWLFLLGTLAHLRQVGQRVLATIQHAHTALKETLKRLSRPALALMDALWTQPCGTCGSTTYATNDCHQCLTIIDALNARLYHRRQARVRDAPT